MSSPSLPQESFSSSNGRGSRLLGRGSRLLFLISSILSPASALAQPSCNQLPKFTDQLATSPLVLKVTESEQAILDMLPANQHLARKTIIDSINSFKDGANPKEQTAAYLWAQSVVASPNAPVAAKEQANIILATLTGSAKLQKSLLSGLVGSAAKEKIKGIVTEESGDIILSHKIGEYSFIDAKVALKGGKYSFRSDIQKPEDVKTTIRLLPLDKKGTPLGAPILLNPGDADVVLPAETRDVLLMLKSENGGRLVDKDGRITCKFSLSCEKKAD